MPVEHRETGERSLHSLSLPFQKPEDDSWATATDQRHHGHRDLPEIVNLVPAYRTPSLLCQDYCPSGGCVARHTWEPAIVGTKEETTQRRTMRL